MLILDNAYDSAFPKVEIKYSPIVEMVADLHLLSVDMDSNIDSCQVLNKSFIRTLKNDKEFDVLSRLTCKWTFTMDLICYAENLNLDNTVAFLAEIKSLPTHEFLYGSLSGLVSKEILKELYTDHNKLERWEGVELVPYMSVETAKDLIRDAEYIQDLMSVFLLKYWNEFYLEKWQETGVIEISAVSQEKKSLKINGPRAYVQSIHNNLIVDNTKIDVVGCPERSVYIEGIKTITVMIIIHKTDSLMLNCIDGNLTIYKSVEIDDIGINDIPDEIFVFLKSIASETKMKILQELYISSKTTKELSDSLGIAPSSVSEHLKALRSAELIYPQRVKNSVYNRFLYENYQAQIDFLSHLFEDK